jgi:hypothetical protein
LVASAYIDQFERANAISSVTADSVRQLLLQIPEYVKQDKSFEVEKVISRIKKELSDVDADQVDVNRFHRTLKGIASQSQASI